MAQQTPIAALNEIRENPGYENMLAGIKAVLEAAVEVGFFSARVKERLLPLFNKARKHPKCGQPDAIRLTECHGLLKNGAKPVDVLATFNASSEQVVTVKNLQNDISTKDRTEVDHDFEIKAGDTGLRAEALALSVARGCENGMEIADVLHALDARMPYAKKPSLYRPLAELREELAWFMEADVILAGAEGDPYGIAARKRIELMKACPFDSVSPRWFCQLKWACKTDLFFLGRVCAKNFTSWTHRRMTDFLVTKDPHKSIEEQDETKDRLTLCARGSFKSTISVLDVLQWTLAFPNDIRAMVCTSVSRLAKKFISELKVYLKKPENAQPTNLQILFSECVFTPEADGKSTEYVVKGRQSSSKDPSVWASSVSSDEVGGHVSLFVGDDCQSVENSNTPETLETLIYKNALLKALVDPKCYRQYLGTPLLPGDLYQHLHDTVPNLKVLFQPALTKKESSAAKEDADCTEADYVLHFPERLSWDFLESTRKEQPEVYRSQYLLDPRGEGVVTFGFDTLVHATVPPESLPDQLSYVSICDMAYSLSDKADRTCICTIGVDNQGRAFVVDIRHSRFTPQEIAEQIVDVWLTFHPVQVVIEASNGSGIMEVIIRNIARDRGIENIRLNFFKVDVKRGAKARRVGCLQPLLLRGQLFFSSAIECLTELYEQFQRFGYTQHDDLPDCVSLAFASGAVSMREAAPDPRVEAALRKDADYRVFHDMLFPQEQPIQPEPVFGGEEGTGTDLDDIYAVPGIPQNYPAGARR